MAVTNYSGLTISNPQLGIQFTKVTDSSSDWSGITNSTYFYDKTDNLIHYKNPSGTILEIFSSSSDGGVSIDPYNSVGSTAAITWDVSGTSTNYQATLTGNTTLALTNVRNGDYGTIILTQDGTGARSLTLGTVNGSATTHRVVNGGGGSAVLTSNGNAIDILTFTYNGSTMFWTVGNDYT
jgi:hypothetical protein